LTLAKKSARASREARAVLTEDRSGAQGDVDVERRNPKSEPGKDDGSMALLDLRQVKLQPRQDERSEFAFFFNATVQFVAAFFEREDFEGFVGRVADPIFLHTKASVEVLLVVAIAANARGGNDLDQEIRSSEDGAMLNDAEVALETKTRSGCTVFSASKTTSAGAAKILPSLVRFA